MYVCINLLFVCMIVKILTHLYLEKWENFWKNQGILSVKKSGNPGTLFGVIPVGIFFSCSFYMMFSTFCSKCSFLLQTVLHLLIICMGDFYVSKCWQKGNVDIISPSAYCCVYERYLIYVYCSGE